MITKWFIYKKLFISDLTVDLWVSPLTVFALFVDELTDVRPSSPRISDVRLVPRRPSRRRPRYFRYTPLSLFSFLLARIKRYFKNPIK
jgi:hypothetical protein